MMDLEKVKGIIPPIVTPVDENENLDADALKRVIDHVLQGGVHGIFVLGSNGEFWALNEENQKKAVETTVNHVSGRVPVYAGTGSITTRGCIRFAEMALGAGADAITVLTPMYIKPSEEELYHHFMAIGKSTSLPIILYNNPGKTSNHLSVELVKRLARIENIVGIKNTTPDLSHSLKIIRETKDAGNFKVLAGSDYYIYALLAHGGAGAVAGSANVAPALVVDIFNKFVAGDHAGAIDAQNRLIPLRNANDFGSFPVVMKDCLNLMGMNVGSPVKPIEHCREEKIEALKKILRELNLIE